MKLKSTIAVASAVAIGCLCCTQPAFSKKKKKIALPAKTELSGAAKDSADFHKKIKDAVVARGMFNTYLDKKGKLYFEIPDSILNKTVLLVNTND